MFTKKLHNESITYTKWMRDRILSYTTNFNKNDRIWEDTILLPPKRNSANQQHQHDQIPLAWVTDSWGKFLDFLAIAGRTLRSPFSKLSVMTKCWTNICATNYLCQRICFQRLLICSFHIKYSNNRAPPENPPRVIPRICDTMQILPKVRALLELEGASNAKQIVPSLPISCVKLHEKNKWSMVSWLSLLVFSLISVRVVIMVLVFSHFS